VYFGIVAVIIYFYISYVHPSISANISNVNTNNVNSFFGTGLFSLSLILAGLFINTGLSHKNARYQKLLSIYDQIYQIYIELCYQQLGLTKVQKERMVLYPSELALFIESDLRIISYGNHTRDEFIDKKREFYNLFLEITDTNDNDNKKDLHKIRDLFLATVKSSMELENMFKSLLPDALYYTLAFASITGLSFILVIMWLNYGWLLGSIFYAGYVFVFVGMIEGAGYYRPLNELYSKNCLSESEMSLKIYRKEMEICNYFNIQCVHYK